MRRFWREYPLSLAVVGGGLLLVAAFVFFILVPLCREEYEDRERVLEQVERRLEQARAKKEE